MSFSSVNPHRRFSEEKYQKNNIFMTENSMLDAYCLLPGQQQKLHAHTANDKYYVIWEGVGSVTIGEETRTLHPGELACAQPGIPHSIANTGDVPLVALVLQAPKPF